MADSKLADLTNAATVADTDILYVVVDPGGTPLDRKATVATLVANHEAAADPHTGYVQEAATPGGELGGTYATPTVATTHSGSSHAGIQSAAEATAAGALSAHEAAADPHTGYLLESAAGALALLDTVGTTEIDNGAVTEAKQTLADNTTGDVSSTKHGYAPKSPADATKFLNGAATPAFALVKDSDLSTSDITTNDVSTTKHGFAPKLPNDATKYLDGTGAYTVPAGGGCPEPLTNGDPSSPALVFSGAGDVIVVGC